MVFNMNQSQLLSYLTRMDEALRQDTMLTVYGSAAFILLGEEDRTSLDIDVAAPYCRVDFSDLQQAAAIAGLPVNPPETHAGDHIEWILPLRLCLPAPRPETELVLWHGRKLTVRTVSPAELIASKLIRYDEIDQSDIQYLCAQREIGFSEIEAAVRSLPSPFNDDAVIHENLKNLRMDLSVWKGKKA
jgi:hypothetical protein